MSTVVIGIQHACPENGNFADDQIMIINIVNDLVTSDFLMRYVSSALMKHLNYDQKNEVVTNIGSWVNFANKAYKLVKQDKGKNTSYVIYGATHVPAGYICSEYYDNIHKITSFVCRQHRDVVQPKDFLSGNGVLVFDSVVEELKAKFADRV